MVAEPLDDFARATHYVYRESRTSNVHQIQQLPDRSDLPAVLTWPHVALAALAALAALSPADARCAAAGQAPNAPQRHPNPIIGTLALVHSSVKSNSTRG